MNPVMLDLFPVKQEKERRPKEVYRSHEPAFKSINQIRWVFLNKNPYFSNLCKVENLPKAISEPYNKNISAGKNTYVYDAHTYHTKVPPEGIKHLIEYYTEPGQTILDPFCGSGMTGVAAAELDRCILLSDLSPAAAFIAYNHAAPIPSRIYLEAVESLLTESKQLEKYLYETRVRETGSLTPMLYMVWSYGLLCGNCGEEFVLWDVARHEGPTVRESKIKSEFECPHCHSIQNKRGLTRTRRYPVQVGYDNPHGGRQEAMAVPDDEDLEKLHEIEEDGLPRGLWYPTNPLPVGINTRQPMAAGIERVDQFYTTRSLWAFAHLWSRALEWPDREVRAKLLFTLTSLYKRITVCSEFRFWGGSGNTANFNVPAIMNEQNVFRAFKRKADTISWYFRDAPQKPRQVRVTCQSACSLDQLPDRSVDYIFTDPPFGGNINYSEMNIIWESWLGVATETSDEAIINKYQDKGVTEYQSILTQAFKEMRRVLKDDSWMTVVFHNSSAAVWSALQSAIVDAGLEVRGTQTFDKKHGTFKQFVSDNAVGYDLVLHCRKSWRQNGYEKRKNDAELNARVFVRSCLSDREGNYTVRYLHVRRAPEFDYRRLYADWLQQAFGRMPISISFDEFRKLVDEERSSKSLHG